MQNIEDEPSADALRISSSDHEVFWRYTDEESKAVMHSVCKRIVDKFVSFSFDHSPNA